MTDTPTTPSLAEQVEEALAKYPPHDGSQHEDVFACNWMDAAQSAGNLFPALAADWQRLREQYAALDRDYKAITEILATSADTNQRLRERERVLTEALKFYADQETYRVTDCGVSRMSLDHSGGLRGEVARAALSPEAT